MSGCCEAFGEPWRLLAIPADNKCALRIDIPGKVIAVGDSLQLAVVPIARVALTEKTILRRFRLSVSLVDSNSAQPLVNEAYAARASAKPNTFSLVIAAEGLMFESLPELSRAGAKKSSASVDAAVSLRFDKSGNK